MGGAEGDSLHLWLLSDLSRVKIDDDSIVLDFDGEGFVLGREYVIVVLIDNDSLTTFTCNRGKAKLGSKRKDVYLLRAFLLHKETNTVVQSPGAYVEGQFRLLKGEGGEEKTEGVPFLFGQPSIVLISPRLKVKRETTIALDFFVHNVILSSASHGYKVNVYVNEKLIETVSSSPYTLVDVPTSGEMKLQIILVAPDKTEMRHLPGYSTATYVCSLV